MISKIKSISFLAPIFFVACTPPTTYEMLGNFTVVSSFDVRNLEYEKKDNAVLTRAEVCHKIDANGRYVSGVRDNMIQRAIDKAIRNGQQKGIDGDMLFNARIEEIKEYRPELAAWSIHQRYRCIIVKGDLIRVKKHICKTQK